MNLHRPLIALALLAVTGVGVTGSGASFTASSADRGNTISAAADWIPPTVDITDPGTVRGTVAVQLTATDTPGSGIATVTLQRASSGTTTWTDICTTTTAPYSCSWATAALADGEYDLRATATDKAGMSATDLLEGVTVDNTAPSSVTVTDPGSPAFGVITVGATAADAGSGIATVSIQRSPAGTGTWAELCADATAPYSCRWDTTTEADGLYDLRAIASDAAGNTRTSALVTGRRVDNTKPSVTLEDPGEFIRGTTTLTATPSSPAGIKSITFQRAPAGTTTWTTICAPTAAPWTCAWNTTTVTDGLYDLRAVMVTGTGATVVSATVASRRVDNTVVRGIDVQSAGRTGGTRGRFEAGDTLTLTWSEVLRPSTLVPGWDGTGTAALSVRLRDGNLIGGSSATDDTVQLLTAGGAATGLGTVDLNAQFVRSGRTVVFAGTASLSTATGRTVVTVTLGTLTSGASSLRTAATAAMAWTPASAATDLAGNPVSTASVTESGASDLDF